MRVIAFFGGILLAAMIAVASGTAYTQVSAKASLVPLGPVDTYFVTQTSLGTPFQVNAGQIAQTKGGTPTIRSYAQLMVSSHIAVNNALVAILNRKAPVPPPTLLKAAYTTIISTLQDETGQTFNRDYVRGQVNYQRANLALYQYEIANGRDPDLKAFAKQTLPRIQSHLALALKLQSVAS